MAADTTAGARDVAPRGRGAAAAGRDRGASRAVARLLRGRPWLACASLGTGRSTTPAEVPVPRRHRAHRRVVLVGVRCLRRRPHLPELPAATPASSGLAA